MTTSPPTAAADDAEAVKLYLGYLSKEITIMGALSAFCVVAPALVLEKLLSAEASSTAQSLWNAQGPVVVWGAAMLFAAGYFFYRQRSILAYFYGQIALNLTAARYPEKEAQPEAIIREADLWTSWTAYSVAFGFVVAGAVLLGDALLSSVWPGWAASQQTRLPWALGVATIGLATRVLVFRYYKREYNPWLSLLEGIRRRIGSGKR